MSTEQVHPRAQPSSLALPIDKGTFDDIVATLRHVVVQQYTALREEFMTKTLGTSPEDRKKRTPAQVDKDFITLKKADPLLSGSDPFNAAWLPGKGADIPPFPPREVHAARQGPHPLSPKDGLMLDAFMLENDRLLAMTIEEMQAVPYIDAWLFKFALTRYFDVESAAPRFLKWRKIIYKHNLSLTWDEAVMGPCIDLGSVTVDPIFAHNSSKPAETPMVPTSIIPAVPDADCDNCPGDAKAVKTAETKYGARAMARSSVQIMTPRHIDYSIVTPAQMIKWVFFVNTVLASSDYFQQTHGCFFVGSALEVAGANLSTNLVSFLTDMVQQCLPVKTIRIYPCNEGWMFTMIVGPLLKLIMSKKMSKKMVVVTSKTYKEPVARIGKERLLSEVGGSMDYQPGPETGAPKTREFVESMMAHAKAFHQKDAAPVPIE